jgi:hypothetical protein
LGRGQERGIDDGMGEEGILGRKERKKEEGKSIVYNNI